MARRLMPVHGLSVKQHTWLRKKWSGMRSRCAPGSRSSCNYHDRGIRVKWVSFEDFAAYIISEVGLPDIESGVKWTLDRIDNDRSYGPGNVRWATYTENLRNRRGGVFVTYRGDRVMLAALAEQFGVSYYLVHDRIFRQRWTPEEAVETPILGKTQRLRDPVWKHERSVTHNGVTKRVREWAAQYGISADLLQGRLRAGWDFEQAIATPSDKGNGSKLRAARYRFGGQLVTLQELSALCGIGVPTLAYRIKKRHMTPEDAASLPPVFGRPLNTSASSQRKTDLMAGEK